MRIKLLRLSDLYGKYKFIYTLFSYYDAAHK